MAAIPDRNANVYNFRRWRIPLHYYLISVNYAVSVIVVMKMMLIFSFMCVAGHFPREMEMTAMCRHCADEIETQSTLVWRRSRMRYSFNSLASTRGPYGVRSKRQRHISSTQRSIDVSKIRRLIDDREMAINSQKLYWSIYWRILFTSSQT